MTLPHLTSLEQEYATRRKGDVILEVRHILWESMLEFEIFDIAILLLIFDISPSPRGRTMFLHLDTVKHLVVFRLSSIHRWALRTLGELINQKVRFSHTKLCDLTFTHLSVEPTCCLLQSLHANLYIHINFTHLITDMHVCRTFTHLLKPHTCFGILHTYRITHYSGILISLQNTCVWNIYYVIIAQRRRKKSALSHSHELMFCLAYQVDG